jgi:hypothetical protein
MTAIAPRPTVLREFDSWDRFVSEAGDETRAAWTSPRSSHAAKLTDWAGTPTFADALNMAARTGWPEGRRLLTESLARVSPRPEAFRSIELSIAGAFPIVPVYCAGSPECMVIDPGADLRHQKPIIRIDYQHNVSAFVEPRDMMLRGAAVLSLANGLEARGFATELRITSRSIAQTKIMAYNIVYKRPDEALDLDRAAFALAHPSCRRRLGFAIYEQHAEIEDQFAHSYGRPDYARNSADYADSTIYVPGSTGRETSQGANAAVLASARELLTEIADSEAGAD